MRRAILLLVAVLLVIYWGIGCAVTPSGNGGDNGGDNGGNGGGGGGGDGDGGGGDGGGGGGGSGGTPATIEIAVDPGTQLGRGDQATLTATVTGAEGDVSYGWSANGGDLVQDPSDASKATWTAPNLAGRYAVTCAATIPDGQTVSGKAYITVPNSAPSIDTLTAAATTVGAKIHVDLSCEASDPNGDALVYTWSADGGTVYGGDVPDAWWLSAADTGDYTLTCTVFDANGASDAESIQIHVLGPSGWDVIIN